MVNDKDLSRVLSRLPREANYFFCQAKIPRALDANELAARARGMGLTGVVEKDVNQAIKKATAASQPDDVIFVGGSTFVVGEVEGL
jgi:dihydrofolate synthase/folylpolyglutamate synthase